MITPDRARRGRHRHPQRRSRLVLTGVHLNGDAAGTPLDADRPRVVHGVAQVHPSITSSNFRITDNFSQFAHNVLVEKDPSRLTCE